MFTSGYTAFINVSSVYISIGDNTYENADYKLKKGTFLTSYVMWKAIYIDELKGYYYVRTCIQLICRDR